MIESFIEIGDKKQIYYRIDGNLSDPVIILLNGSIFNFKQYDYVFLKYLKTFLGSQYCYIQYDYIGIGKSSDLVGEFDLITIGDEHIAFMDKLDIKQAHLFGISKGSLISCIVAAKYPSRVLSIGGYGNPNLAHPSRLNTKQEFQNRVDRMKALEDIYHEEISKDNYNRVYDIVFQPTVFRNGQKGIIDFLKNKYVKWKLKPLLLNTKIVILKDLYQYYTRDVDNDEMERYIAAMKSIKIPILLLHGSLDEIIDIEGCRLLSQWLSNSVFIEIPDFRHSSPILIYSQGKTIMNHYADFLRNIH
ncbi:MAG: alpha/beta hydrolase [Candidatus Heimdallarchaeota archaeon]|nr:alpha/beta hydrolase [Candidatus Heimdallarchaeota archaeon]MDH5646963.1 alpha/beta hydrolase [Candidatus Heimdallarchaeota archaeon]